MITQENCKKHKIKEMLFKQNTPQIHYTNRHIQKKFTNRTFIHQLSSKINRKKPKCSFAKASMYTFKWICMTNEDQRMCNNTQVNL